MNLNQGPRRQPTCLLIAPLSFYTFHRVVADGLSSAGYCVSVLNDEFPANTFGKILGKIALPLLRRLTLDALRRRLDQCDRFDLVLIIKGRGLGADALAYLRSRAARVVGYNFDSFRFNPSPLDWHRLTDRYATFDITDAKAHGIPLVHLFSATECDPQLERSFDISIIQKLHSDRLRFARQVLNALPPNAQSFIYLFESSRIHAVLGYIRNPILYSKMWPYIHFQALSYSTAMEVLGRSKVTFDYAHPSQSGITIRCFEAQSLGVAVLTNNLAAVESGKFEPGAIAHFPRSVGTVQLRRLISQLAECTPSASRRSLDAFLTELLGTNFPKINKT